MKYQSLCSCKYFEYFSHKLLAVLDFSTIIIELMAIWRMQLSWLEHQIVDLRVAGSRPVIRPTLPLGFQRFLNIVCYFETRKSSYLLLGHPSFSLPLINKNFQVIIFDLVLLVKQQALILELSLDLNVQPAIISYKQTNSSVRNASSCLNLLYRLFLPHLLYIRLNKNNLIILLIYN